MTTVTMSIIGENITSVVSGFGRAELQKCLDKVTDGLPWTLTVSSANSGTFPQAQNPGRNWNKATLRYFSSVPRRRHVRRVRDTIRRMPRRKASQNATPRV